MRILCFGDSNTYGYDPRSYLGDRYPADTRWTGRLPDDWEVMDAGQNGRRIPCQDGELTQVRRLLEMAPDVFAVMLGSNDLLQGLTAEAAAARMEACLIRLKPCLDLCAVLLIAPPPMRPGTWATETAMRESSLLAERYEALARRLGILFADAGQWDVELAYDGVHFSPAGHLAFARGFQDALQSLEIPEITEVTLRSPALLKQLTAVWESSVRATHAFLTEADIQAIGQDVPEALAAVPHLAVISIHHVPVGFLGVDGRRLEMLFLSPDQRGRHLGRRLLAWGLQRYGIREVCVNEQNPQALGFYVHMGFHVYKRTDLDEQGRPFPLLYLRLPVEPA